MLDSMVIWISSVAGGLDIGLMQTRRTAKTGFDTGDKNHVAPLRMDAMPPARWWCSGNCGIARTPVEDSQLTDKIRIESVTKLSHNWGRFDDYEVTHARRDGSMQTVRREIYDHGSAAAVLLYAASTNTVILTRQFRLPPHLNGDPAWLIEAPAGMLDGEAPAIAAHREAVEETGYEPEGMVFLFDAYMSPGSLTEKCACYLARYTPGKTIGDGGGLAHEGEDIEVFELGFDAALGMIESGEIADAKTILMLQALALRLVKGEVL
jgi:nudix-type nucleoside diphosphatase (YffH/AdpP family)